MRRVILVPLIIVGVALFAYFLVKLPWHEAVLVVTEANPLTMLAYLFLSVLIKILLAWRWQVILQAKKITIPFRNAVAYRFASAAVSFVAPGPRVGGDAVAAAMLQRHQTKQQPISFSKALSTVLIDRSVEVQAFAALFFLGVLYLAWHGDIPAALRVLMVGGSIVLLALMVLFAVNTAHGKPFLTRLVRRFSKNPVFQKHVSEFEHTLVTFYKEDKKEFVVSHLISAAAWFVSLIEYKCLLLVLGYDAPLYAIFIVYSFIGLAYLVPIPLALGSLEGSQAAAFSLLGLSAALGVVLALLTRLRDVIFTVAGFMVLVYYGFTPRKTPQPIR